MSIVSFVVKKAAPEAPYHYIGDNIISTTNWPNSGTAGSSYDLVTYESGTRSILTGINGHQAMRFANGGYNSARCDLPSMVNSITLFMVVRRLSVNTYFDGPFWSIGNESVHYLNPIAFSHNLGANQFSVYGGVGDIVGIGNIAIASFPTSQWMVLTFRYTNSLWFSGNTKSSNVRKNGVSLGSGTGTPNVTSGTTPRIRMGTAFALNTDGDRDFAEFIYYTQVLDNDTCTTIENSLKTKYGIV